MNPNSGNVQNYYKLRSEFVTARDQAASQIVRDSLSQAIAQADVCVELFVQFPPAIRAYEAWLRDQVEAAMKESARFSSEGSRAAKEIVGLLGKKGARMVWQP